MFLLAEDPHQFLGHRLLGSGVLGCPGGLRDEVKSALKLEVKVLHLGDLGCVQVLVTAHQFR